ncbi:hypothetical protein LINPERPRIM_LOCUS6471 [Linum perenne]
MEQKSPNFRYLEVIICIACTWLGNWTSNVIFCPFRVLSRGASSLQTS